MSSFCILKNAPSFVDLRKREERRFASIIKDDKRHAEDERRIKAGAVDKGTDGNAMISRPSSYSTEFGVRRMTDVSPIDFYFHTSKTLSLRQADAGWRLSSIYRTGFPQPRMVGRLGEAGRELVSPEQEEETVNARRLFAELTSGIPLNPARMIARIVRNEYPDTQMGVTHLIDGLDIVADRLKLPR